MTLPTNDDDLYAWIISLTLGYIGSRYLVGFCRMLRSDRAPRPSATFFMTTMFNGATFAISVMLLIGIFNPAVLTLLGSTKPFLVIAALAGLGYTAHSLFES